MFDRIKVKAGKRFLIVSNIILLFILVFIIIREDYPLRVYKRFYNQFDMRKEYQKNCEYTKEIDLYKQYNKKGNIVMLGNSITYGVNWNELLNRNDIINRGIGSDTTEGFLSRMEYIYKAEPKICFIMGEE
ncbi:MAG: hypothetical protein CR982_06980 [Candidatus Cloacimonadota bacterium]|nr:MAG: hypothetical protein CR982_06980 [Candidatus Cloacimonadota bacterium]PIE80658.1 MAG: hypothetical protein CSA15_01785 [Candidatus Delongbacteria bacterium]